MVVIVGCGADPGAADSASDRLPSEPIAFQIGGPTGHTIRDDFVGLSVESASIAQGKFDQKELGKFLSTIGKKGVLRVGGNSGDEMFWTQLQEPMEDGYNFAVTPESLEALAALIRSTEWRVILAVNLKAKDPGRAADFAAHASKIFGNRLIAIEVGNEPNVYYNLRWPSKEYLDDFNSYVKAIRARTPSIGIVGPDVNLRNPSFVRGFAGSVLDGPSISALTGHVYPLSGCEGNKPTVEELMSQDSRDRENESATAIVEVADLVGVPAVLDEVNSVNCGGAEEVSEVFAAALWALDFSLRMSMRGIGGTYFHGDFGECFGYSPVCEGADGELRARPIYYGLAAFSLVGAGNFLKVSAVNGTSSALPGLGVFAVERDSGASVVVVDSRVASDGVGQIDLRLNLGGSYSKANVTRLTSSGGITATSGISLGGATVDSAGALTDPVYDDVEIADDSSALIKSAAGSATIIRFEE